MNISAYPLEMRGPMRKENVEECLYYVLLDKSLLSSLLLLQTYREKGAGKGVTEWGMGGDHAQMQQLRLQLNKFEKARSEMEVSLDQKNREVGTKK